VPGKLVLYPPQRAPRFLVVRDGETLEIGRDPTCGLVVEDPRVSKRHARLLWTGAGWALEDLGSKNGTTVNARPAAATTLHDGDWVSLGGLAARFEWLSAAQADTLEAERLSTLQASADLKRRLGADLEPVDLLLCFLELAREVTRTERGFVVVLGPNGKLRVEVAAGFTRDEVSDERFRGSVGAVKQALEGGPVVIADVPADPRLGRRPSVMALGIGAIACVPLRHEGRTLGVIYVDSRKPLARGFTELDIEILEALANRTALVLAGALSARKIPQVLTRDERGLIAHLQQRLDELLPAV
jgi:hypothetical protein